MGRIGRYEIDREIGRGAMGVVHLAHDPHVRRPVAIKSFHLPEGLSDAEVEEYRQRFFREAQAAGGLTHPGIVTIFDADRDPDTGRPFIAMEYVPGRSLRELLRVQGPLEPDRAIAMADALAAALGVAHAAGVVHRDIKPANVLIHEEDGRVKVADFGVARLAASGLTRTGESLGSPGYMSPEQIRARAVDGRSDLFSLAVILYEMLCGARPFAGEDLSSIVYSVVHETTIPISKRVTGLPSGLDAFFDRALAKKPDERFPDAGAFRAALAEAAASGATPDAESTVVAGTPLLPLEPAETTGAADDVAASSAPGQGLGLDAPPEAGERGSPSSDAAWIRTVQRLSRRPRLVGGLAALAVLVVVLALVAGGGERPLRGEVVWPEGEAPTAAGDGGAADASRLEAGVGGAASTGGRTTTRASQSSTSSPAPLTGGRLVIDVESKLAAGELEILIDKKIVVTQRLAASRKGPKLLGKKRLMDKQEFEVRAEIPVGQHKVVARVNQDDNRTEYRDAVIVNVAPGDRVNLRLEIGRDPEWSLELRKD